ncbi:MAG: BatD family protein [bacterium]|nr:BatD family protein [bacterium]
MSPAYHCPRLVPLLVLLGPVLWMSTVSRAQGPQGTIRFHAQVDQTQVVVGESITYSLVIENPTQRGASPSAPDFGGLEVVSGPALSQQFITANGATRSIVTYRWELRAPREGSYVIGPSQLALGQAYQTDPITVVAARQPQPQLPLDLQRDNILPAQTQDSGVNAMLDGRLFLRQTVSNPNPYVGEPVLVSIQLYNDRVNFQPQQIHPPDIQGAVVEAVFQASSVDYQLVTHFGRQFQVAPIWQAAVIPGKPGPLTFAGFALDGGIPVNRRATGGVGDPFDAIFNDPFFGPTRLSVNLPAPQVSLNVRPLPAGAPADFSGTVGAFTLTAATDRAQINADDLVTLDLTLEGRGAIELASPPIFPKNSDFELTGQNYKVEKENKGGTIGGRKRFEFVLHPSRPGKLEVPPIRYSLFDPFTAQYRTLQTRPIEINVAPGRPQPLMSEIRPKGAGGGALTERDLNYLLPIARLDTDRPPGLIFHSILFWNGQLFALALLALVIQRDRRRNRLDPARVRRAGAWRALKKRLAACAQKRRKGAGREELAADLEHAVRAFIADRFDVSPEGLTRPEIEQLLHSCAMPAERIARLCELLEACAAIRYAPAGATAGDIDLWSQEIAGLLKECHAE